MESAALFVAIALLLAVALTLIVVAIVREWIRQRAKKDDKDQALLGAIQSVHAAMQVVAERMNDKGNMIKENHAQVINEVHELGTLVLDIERRLRDEIVENRNVIREGRREGTKIYNTNADGGQTNQGGSVHGEQR